MSKLYGAQVLNTGYIENIYFNTEYNYLEIADILKQLELPVGGTYYVVRNDSGSVDIVVNRITESEFTIYDNATSTKLFSNVKDDDLRGWQEDLVSISIFDNVVDIFINGNITNNYGDLNYRLVQAIAMTPFTNEILELKPFIHNIANSVKRKKKVDGTINAQNIANEIDGFELGVDTRDASASKYDMRRGKTAYVGNLKIAGEVDDYFGEYDGEAHKSELAIPELSDYELSQAGVLTWQALDVSSLSSYSPEVEYIIQVNEFTLSTKDTTIKIFSYLKNGENDVTVTGAIKINTSKGKKVEFTKLLEFSTFTLNIPDGRSNYNVASSNGKIYIVGGYIEGIPQHKVLAYDTTKNQWEETNINIEYVSTYMNCACTNDFLYYTMPYSTEDNDKLYGILLEDGTTYSMELSGFQRGPIISDDNYVYVSRIENKSNTGNFSSPKVLRTRLKFSNTTYVWEESKSVDISENSIAFITLAVSNGYCYVFGGSSERNKRAVKLDFDNLTIEELPKLQRNSNLAYTISADGLIYIVGGRDYSLSSTYFNTVQAFDTKTNTTTLLDYTLSTPIYNENYKTLSCVLGRTLYIFFNTSTNELYRLDV